METIPVISLGAAAFWIALAAVLIAGGYHKLRREQMKQETLLKLIEKTGQLDEAQVKLLFPPPPPAAPHQWPPPWHQPADPTETKRTLQGFGVAVMCVGAGIAVLGTLMLSFGTVSQQEGAIGWFGLASVVASLGLGLYVSSRFATGPAPRDEHD